jgi:hypothetical protein
MLPNGDRLGRLKEAARTVGELIKIHLSSTPFSLRGDMVLQIGNTRV